MFAGIKKFFTDMFQDDKNKWSNAKFWSNMAYAAVIEKFIVMPAADPVIWGIILTVATGHAIGNKIINAKAAAQAQAQPNDASAGDAQ